MITLAELYTRRNRAWASIHEFKPSLAAEAFVTHTYVLYCALLAATPLAMAATWRRQATWYRPILLVAFIAMSLTIRRNIVLLGPVGCWLLVTAIGRLQWGNRQRSASARYAGGS